MQNIDKKIYGYDCLSHDEFLSNLSVLFYFFNQTNHNYEIVQDVKAQAQFLQELDRIEKRRHEEQEREVLIKAAKVRIVYFFY